LIPTKTVYPQVGLQAIAALRKLLEQLETLQVRNARERGWSWQDIAYELRVSQKLDGSGPETASGRIGFTSR